MHLTRAHVVTFRPDRSPVQEAGQSCERLNRGDVQWKAGILWWSKMDCFARTFHSTGQNFLREQSLSIRLFLARLNSLFTCSSCCFCELCCDNEESASVLLVQCEFRSIAWRLSCTHLGISTHFSFSPFPSCYVPMPSRGESLCLYCVPSVFLGLSAWLRGRYITCSLILYWTAKSLIVNPYG